MSDALRAALEYAAQHTSSDWSERCQEIVRRARAALAAQPVQEPLTMRRMTGLWRYGLPPARPDDFYAFWRAVDYWINSNTAAPRTDTTEQEPQR